MPKKGYKQSLEHIEKQRQNTTNRYKSGENFGFKKGNQYGKINKGRKSPWAIKNSPFKKGHHINKGISKTEDTRKKLSTIHKYNWLIGKEKINSGNFKKGHIPHNKNKKGYIVKEDTKKKTRLSMIKYIKEKCNGFRPNLGTNEKQLLDEFELSNNIKLIRQYEIDGYFVDGYCKELNLVVEVDERPKINERDIRREHYIRNKLKCKFVRIKDY
jgi:very-short-patch-repair endonuclease